jgi:hypothetical protein
MGVLVQTEVDLQFGGGRVHLPASERYFETLHR